MENEIIQFTHLHTHSPEGSLLDGFMRIDKAIDKAKRLGMDALGISDHGTMAAHEKFYNECKKAGIHPVLGMEAYLTPNKDFRKSDFDDVSYVEAEDSTEEEAKYIFSFLTEQEVEESEFSWQRVEAITPKKENTRIYNIAKESYILPIVEKTLPEGQEIPKGKAAKTRMANSYRKAQTLSNKKELYIQADTKMRDLFAWYPRMTHQMLIAMNNEGYQNLLKLNAIGQMDGFYGKPRIDFEDIKKYGKGIAATTACLGGMVPQLILRGRPEVAKKEIQRLVEAFDEVYLEIQPSRQEDQHVVNAQLIEWSRELGVPLIATTDAHMVDKDEMSIHAAMTHIGTSYEDDNDISAYDSAYLMTPEEILRMGIPREALQNAYDLSHRCQVDFLENKETKFPEYDVPEGYTMDEYLRELTEQGLFDIMLKKDYIEDYQAYQERLDYELKIISDKKLSAYFVIVWDYINYAREQGIYVGPGRGSAAGSLIAYTLGITNLDPLKYDLLFERFLNPERPGLPDVDTDFQHDKKDEVLDYIVKKYGKDRVAKIGTYTQMSSKLVLKDVARVLDIDHNWVNDLNKHLPVENGNVMPLEEAIVDVPEFVRANEKEPELFELASDLQSMPRNTSVHACFVGDTKIRTEDGMEDIINVPIGEMVLTHEGRYRPVAKTMVSEVDILYELDVESYKKTKGTGDHPFYVSELKEIELNSKKNGEIVKVNALTKPVWKALKDLRPGLDYVYLPKKPGQDVKSEDIWPQESTKPESAYQINGNIWLQVKDVVEIELSEPIKVYNLEVEDDHSYTANGLAVHNCFIAGTPVQTSSGLKNIEDVLDGDTVLTHKNRYKEVAKTIIEESNDLYELNSSGAFPITATGNHKFLIRERKDKRLRKYKDGVDTLVRQWLSPEWKELKDIDPKKDYLGLAINQESIIPEYDDLDLPFDNPDFWWLIGCWVGDGWTQNLLRTRSRPNKNGEYTKYYMKNVKICCSKVNGEHKIIEEKLGNLNFEYNFDVTPTTYVYTIKDKDKYLHTYLQHFGDYSHTKRMHQDVVNLPVALATAFLDGYLAADGNNTVRGTESRWSAKTTSKELEIQLIQLIGKVYNQGTSLHVIPAGIDVIEGREVNAKEKYQISFSKEPRQKQRFHYENGTLWMKIKSIDKLKTEETIPVYNLSVYDDNSYTVNNMIAKNCGVQISPVPLDENIPLMSAVDRETKERQVVTQYEGGTLEDLGFVKFDILSLKNLTVMHIAVEEIERRHGVHIDINELEPEDPKVFETIKKGNTAAIFQLESSGMTEVFTGLEVVDFEALIAGVALYRPGPMENIPEYQDRANGLKPVRYPTPELEEILKPTHGITVYQEQLMAITQVLGGYTAGQSDSFRKAVGKKSQEVMDKELPALKNSIIDNGYDPQVAEQIIHMIEPFVGYGFNKSHSAAYAFIAYQTAYLKTYYPAEFFAASLAVFGDNTDKLITYITNAKENGIEVLPPDVNESKEQFSVIDDKTIRFGLDEIKSMPERAVHSVIKNRPYETAYELVEKNAKSEVNKTAIKVLALSGALDGIASEIGNRQEIKDRLYIITQRTMDEDDPEVFTDRHKLERERQYLGTYMSGHPLDGFKTDVEWAEVERTGETFNVHAVLSTIKRITTKKGDPMAFLGLSFADRAFDGVLFPNSYMREMAFRKDDPLVTVGDLITEGMIVKVTGLFEENHRGEQSFIIRNLTIPVRANADYEEHIKSVQDEKGVEQEAPEVIPAPSFDMSNFY